MHLSSNKLKINKYKYILIYNINKNKYIHQKPKQFL